MHILIPKGTSERSAMWTLMDLITQQIVLQKKKKKKKKKKKSIKFKSSRRRIKKKRWIKNFYMKL